MSYKYGLLLSLAMAGMAFGQGITLCSTSSAQTSIRAEGLSERIGDLTLNCTGSLPAGTIVNLTLFTNTNITNRTFPDAGSDIALTVNGSPGSVPVRFAGPNQVAWLGLSLPSTSQGTIEVKIQNIRVNANMLGSYGANVMVYFTISGPITLPLLNPLVVASTLSADAASPSGQYTCCSGGSPLPSTFNFNSFIFAGTKEISMRFTEGFATALAPRTDWSNLNADTGVRLVGRIYGIPTGGRIFVPNLIAGSTADKATSAISTPASAGVYSPGHNQLLLIRVNGADSNGVGGLFAVPQPTVASTILDSVAEVSVTDGSAYVVYEVVDANQFATESLEIPVFIGANTSSTITWSLGLGPFSSVGTTTSSAPIPRFSSPTVTTTTTPATTPVLSVDKTSLALGNTATTGYISVENTGGGTLQWTASTGSKYLTLSPSQGTGSGVIRVDAVLDNVPAGNWTATIEIDGGSAGLRTVLVALTNAAPIVTPQITSVGNAADPTVTALVPGSLGSLFGSHLSGNSVQVKIAGKDATIIYSGATQVNFVVPATLTSQDTAQLEVLVDGVSSGTRTVNLSANAPSIFSPGVSNADWSLNSEQAPAPAGGTVQIFATGLPSNGPIMAKVHDRMVTPAYGGMAPGLTGVQQVNAQIPADLPAMQSWVYVCSGDVCSAPSKLWISR